MKITRHTKDQLILDHTPWLFGVVFGAVILVSTFCIAFLPFNGHPEGLFAIPFLIVGTLLFKGFVRRDQAIFDRVAGTVVLRHRTLTNYASETINLTDVEKATLDETEQRRSGSNGATRVFRPAIVANGQVLPLRDLYSNMGRYQDTVDTINRWLST